MPTPRLLILWEKVRTSYWFVPGLMAAGAIGLSLAAVWIDGLLPPEALEGSVGIYAGGPEGARAVLSTIAGSTITVAGVLFSITVVTLSLASSQFGPRLLRNFMADTTNQVVLGAFVGTFLYCLLVLRTVRGPQGQPRVPDIAVTLGVVLAVINLGMLIYFIHHVSVSIQAMTVIYGVRNELNRAIRHLFPEKIGEGEPQPTPPRHPVLPDFESQGRPVLARSSRYVQGIDGDTLLGLAREKDLVIRLEHRPGDFVVEGAVLARAWPADRTDDETAGAIHQAFVLGSERTATQDLEYSVGQLVEIAVRALSPGVNDPFTAIACLDRLGEGLAQVAQRVLPSPYRYDKEGRLRILAPILSFADIADSAFDAIRQYARDSVGVTLRLLETITTVSEHVSRSEDREVLRRHVEAVVAQHPGGWPEKDQRAFEERRRAALAALSERAPRATGT
jgi:uncharacterized membrane protein